MNVRPLTHDDLPALADFLARDEERLTGRPSRIAATDVREWTSLCDFENDSWLCEDESGIAAVAWMYGQDDLGIGIVALALPAVVVGGRPELFRLEIDAER